MSEQIITKRCCCCKQAKPISEFHKNRSKKDKLATECKTCLLKYVKAYQQTKKGKATKKRYQQSEKGKIAKQIGQIRYLKTEKGKIIHRTIQKRFCIRHPERVKAQRTVNNFIKAGKLPRPNTLQCHYCPKPAQQYHHPDYNKPLYIFPICKKCHRKIPNLKLSLHKDKHLCRQEYMHA